jgi:DNA-binding GntR family transcriptional regulator
MKDQSAPLLSELAYQRILEALFDSRLPMGARITQGDLVEVTQMPVGPLRDALRILEADGIVTIHPRSGIEVIRRSTELTRSTYQFRTIIERSAARSLARNASEHDLRRLDRLHHDAIASFEALDPNANVADALGQIEDHFHPALVGALDNALVDTAYRRLQLMARIIKVNDKVYPRAAIVSVAEHLDVISACLARDPDAAEAAIGQHLSNALARNLGMA